MQRGQRPQLFYRGIDLLITIIAMVTKITIFGITGNYFYIGFS